MDRDRLMGSAVDALRQGRLRDAHRLSNQLIDGDPSFIPALTLSGIVAAQIGDREGSIRILSDVVSRDPRSFEAWNWLSMQLRMVGRSGEARDASRTMIQLEPNRYEGYNSLGMCLLDEKRWDDAVHALELAIALAPKMAMLHNNLGLAFEKLGRKPEAEQSFRCCITLAPGMPNPYGLLAELLSDQGRYRESAPLFRMAYEREPESTRGLMNLAKCLFDEDRLDEARRVLEQLVAMDSLGSGALASLGHVQYLLGDFESARRTLKSSIEQDPDSVRAYVDLVYSGPMTAEDSWLITAIKQRLSNGDLAEQELSYLEFALGKAFDDLGDYVISMGHYDEANRVMLGQVTPIDREFHSARIDRLTRTYSAEAMRGVPAGSDSDRPILIAGMIRSGTTLTEQILSSHPQVGAGGELRFWLERGGNEFPGKVPSPKELAELAADYMGELERVALGRPRVTDKMPLNYLFLGPIHLAFPNARIIHCRRDPLDNCLSIYLTPFRGGLEFGHDRDTIVYAYKEYLRLMDHWRAVLPSDRFLEIDYEDLVANRELVTRGMLDFCGLPWDDACLEPQNNERAVRTPSAWQVRQPIYSTSVGRWRRFEPWLGSLAQLRSLQRSPDPGS